MSGRILVPIYQNAHDRHGQVFDLEIAQAARRFARHDESGDKDGLATSAGIHDGLFRGAEHMKWRTGVFLDVEAQGDQAPPDFKALHGLLKARGIYSVLWTTFNHSEAEPRIRVWIPFDEPVDVRACGRGVDRMMSANATRMLRLIGVVDIGKFGCSSLMYLARHRPGSPHQSAIVEGTVQSGAEFLAVATMANEKAEISAAQLAALRASTQFPPEIMNKILAYNDGHEITDLFSKYGYTRRGERWKSPGQTGNAATVLIDGGSRWVSFSETDLADGVGQQSASGECAFGDAFQLYVYYEHNGNFRAALRSIGAQEDEHG